ncbi:MAG TPA: ABC transporter substrate-binding protein [Rhabdaerophilum sp.]|nr:ABC transporter substrate-binding protein [Rhabdaerophilum sp.]
MTLPRFPKTRLVFRLGLPLLALAAGPVPVRAEEQVNMLCAPVSQWCEAIVAAFQKDTGIKVNMARKSAGEILAQLKSEAQNPKTDVWFGGSAETHFVAGEQGLLEPYTSPNMKDLQLWAVKVHEQSDKHCVGVSSGVIGIVHNKELAKKKGFKPPKTWDDLIDPSLKGEAQMPNPNSSSTAYTIIAGIIQLRGEEAAFDYLKKLHANINSYTRSGSAPQRAASQGETGVAITFNFDVPTDIAKGFPIEAHYPVSGTSYEVACLSIMKGARNLAAAQKFYDWYLTPRAMDISASIGQYHIPAHKGAKPDANIPDLTAIRLVDYDFKKFGSAEVRKRILERWQNEIGALPINR